MRSELTKPRIGEPRWAPQKVASEALLGASRELVIVHNGREIHLRADRAARYQPIAEVMADCANAGTDGIGFVSEPEKQ